MGLLKIVFPVSLFLLFFKKSVLGNTCVTMETLQKLSGYRFLKTSKKSLTLIFRESIFNFDVGCVSRKFTFPPIQKLITNAVYFISSASENG